MKRCLLFLLLTATLNAFAQQAPIAIVSTSGVTTLTSSLDSAALLAQDGDVIYLPGGTLAGMSGNFTKRVTVIGVGHNPDSTAATGRTYINGSIGFHTGAEGSMLDGVYVSDKVNVCSNVKVYRTSTAFLAVPCTWNSATAVLVEKCVIRNGIYASEGCAGNSKLTNSYIRNSIIAGNFTQDHVANTFENTLFLHQANYDISQASQCTFRNCIFAGVTFLNRASNSFFYNNIFGADTPTLTDASNAIGNHVNQADAATFQATTAANYFYDNDYQLKSSSPGKNGGTDGKDIGIYGGASPWVKGNIPPNSHIRTKNVDATTGSGGTLRVRFNVRTQ